MTAVSDPVQPIAHSAQLESDSVAFMSPELLVPEEFGKKDVIPTSQSDIYAFALFALEVREQDYGYLLPLCITFPRFSLLDSHSMKFGNRRWRTMYFGARAQPNQRTPRSSGFLIRRGVSSNAAGIVQWSRDQWLGKL